MQRRETEKDAFPSYHQQQFERHEVSIWLSAFSIPSLGSWCLVSPHHPFQLTHICSISLHFCILASNFHRMGLHTIFSMLNTGILANGNWWVPIIHSHWNTHVLFLNISAYLLQILIWWVSISHLTSIFSIPQVSLKAEIQITAFKAHSIYFCWIRRHS